MCEHVQSELQACGTDYDLCIYAMYLRARLRALWPRGAMRATF